MHWLCKKPQKPSNAKSEADPYSGYECRKNPPDFYSPLTYRKGSNIIPDVKMPIFLYIYMPTFLYISAAKVLLQPQPNRKLAVFFT